MSIPNMDSYKKGIHNFPPDAISFKSKKESWHKEYAEAILSDYVNNRCGIAFNEVDKMIENSRYAEGTNSEDLFKDIITDFKRDEGERIAYSQIDYTIIPIIAKFKSVFVGILSNANFRATANSIDPISMSKKAFNKAMLWHKRVFMNERKEIDFKLGVMQTEPEYIPETKQELNMYEKMGGLKLGMEEALEAGLDHCFYISRWSEEIMPLLLGDLFDNNICACRDYYDPNTHTVKQEYISPKLGIVQNSNDPAFNKSKYKGYIRNYTVADLRAATGWSEDKIRPIAEKWANTYGNGGINSWYPQRTGDSYGPNNFTNNYEYDPMIIPVAVLEFESTMYEYDVERIDEYGNKSYYKTDYDRKYNRENRKSITTPIKVWHKVSMPIGSDQIFDWGLQHDIPRPRYEDARSSFHFYRVKGKSLCERAIPHAKQVQLGYLKVQAFVAKASPPGIAVEWGSLTGMSLNKKEVDPMDLLTMKTQTGNIVYTTSTARGRINVAAGGPPIMELQGSISLADQLAIIEHHINQIRELTGVNDKGGRDETTATGAKLSFMSTDIALKSLYNAYLAIVKDTAINTVARIRDLLAYSEEARELYGTILGMSKIELLDIVADLPTANIAIKIEIDMTDEQQVEVIDAAKAAMQPGREGHPPLTYSEFLLVQRMARSGNVKGAQAFIAKAEADKLKVEILRANQAKKADTEMAVMVSQEKTKAEKELLTWKTNEEIRKYKEEKDKDDELAKNQHTRDMELERLKLSAKETVPAQ